MSSMDAPVVPMIEARSPPIRSRPTFVDGCAGMSPVTRMPDVTTYSEPRRRTNETYSCATWPRAPRRKAATGSAARPTTSARKPGLPQRPGAARGRTAIERRSTANGRSQRAGVTIAVPRCAWSEKVDPVQEDRRLVALEDAVLLAEDVGVGPVDAQISPEDKVGRHLDLGGDGKLLELLHRARPGAIRVTEILGPETEGKGVA